MKKPLIKIQQHYAKPDVDLLIFENGVTLGQLYQEVDGYYVFVPETSGGYWEAYVLREIANLLDKKNAKWHKKVKRDLQKMENKTWDIREVL
jgi:hypothetical protein